MNGSLTGQLADWAGALNSEMLPQDVRADSRMRIIDAVGVRMAGARTEFARTLADALDPWPGDAPGRDRHARALMNGAIGTCLDYDDTHAGTLIHPTVPVLSAALEAALANNRDGGDLLVAVAAGVEIACRIACAAPGEFHARGFSPTGTLVVFGAAAAAAMLLDGRPPAIAGALAIAAGFGAGVMQPFVEAAESRYLYSGNAAASGLLAARLAVAGVGAADHMVEGPAGFLASHIGSHAPADLERIVAGLDTRWESRSILLKRYPTGFVAQPYIDAVLSLERDVASQVESLVCVVPSAAVGLVCEPRAEKLQPANAGAARVSMYHMLAEAMHFGAIDAHSFSADRLADPAVRRLRERIGYRRVQTSDQHGEGDDGPRIILQLQRQGGELVIPVAEKAMEQTGARAKFITNAAPDLGASIAEQIADQLAVIDDRADGPAMIEALFGRPGTRPQIR